MLTFIYVWKQKEPQAANSAMSNHAAPAVAAAAPAQTTVYSESEFFELPKKYARRVISDEEIDAINVRTHWIIYLIRTIKL